MLKINQKNSGNAGGEKYNQAKVVADKFHVVRYIEGCNNKDAETDLLRNEEL